MFCSGFVIEWMGLCEFGVRWLVCVPIPDFVWFHQTPNNRDPDFI